MYRLAVASPGIRHFEGWANGHGYAHHFTRDGDTFITTGGADVLAPNWADINPLIKEMFGQ